MWSPSNVFNSWIWSRGIITIYTSCFVGLYASSYWPISSFSFFRWLVILFLWIAVYFDPFQLYLSTCVSWYLLCFCLFVCLLSSSCFLCYTFPTFFFVFNSFFTSSLFSFLCCVVLCFLFYCFRPVSGVPNVVSVSGLFILDWPFGFL